MLRADAIYLSTAEVAEQLHLSERTVRHLLVTGKMCRFIRTGRAIRIKRQTFEEWVARQEEDSLSPGVQWVGD